MIIWLASYPKSGNTFVRTLLSAYFFSNDGFFDFKYLKSIKQFPSKKLFVKIGITSNNENEILKNYIPAQEYINKKAPLILLKTHSSLFDIDETKFTNLDNSLGVIYVVRDPRNIVTSFSNHFNLSLNDSAGRMISDTVLGESTDKKIITYILSWKKHYESWKLFEKEQKYLLVKYEDLIKNPKEILIKMLTFIFKMSNNNSNIDLRKVDNVISSTAFEKLKKMEKNYGFVEKPKNMKSNFFKLGNKNKWQNILDKDIEKIITNEFIKEMRELEYI
ncbi:sulfotransferase domain-containing protein [Candidatus Pelagibacter sp.]|nr:sulfotransferase domain-containing protein [Candidatus Pelagibacter sp.]